MLVWAQQETAGGRVVMMDGSLQGTMDEETDRWEMQKEGHTEVDVSCLLRDKVRLMERWGLTETQMSFHRCVCEIVVERYLRFENIHIIFGVDIVY